MKNLIISAMIFIGILLFIESAFDVIDNGAQKSIDKIVQYRMPPCIQMYNAIDTYADKYKIPRRFAFGIAYEETRYQGPFHWDYKHDQTSFAGAIGPMQIMPSTGKMMWPKEKVTADRLKNDITFNVETSMKLLRRLYDKYGDWKTVFGAYNTGRPCVNNYAVNVYKHQYNFKKF